MKSHVLIFFFIQFYLSCYSQEVSLMTYNIRLDVASDGENAWPNRREKLVSQIQFYTPDIFGIQEGLPHQVKYIEDQMSGYNFIGQGRDGENKGEYSALYFNVNEYAVEQQGTFWLSETPGEVSMGWDASYPRICTYGLLVNKNIGVRFFVFNTHLDHIGNVARKKGLELILQKMEELNTANLPVVLMGDFNLEPQSAAISMLNKQMNDSKDISIEPSFGPEGTFNAFRFQSIATKRIDYVFVSKSEKIEVQKYGVLNNSYNLKYPSDHFPVYVKMLIRK